MKRLLVCVLALSFTGCAHKQMTNGQLARSAATVGAAVVITSAIIYAEYRSSTAPELPQTTPSALPPR
jgi:hypothetical protein